jgi:predicted DNA-binding transcriptional regulator AlpA
MHTENHSDTAGSALPVLLVSESLRLRLHPEMKTRSWKNWLWNAIKNHGFPKGLRLGARAVSWREDEVLRWVESRVRGGRFDGRRG